MHPEYSKSTAPARFWAKVNKQSGHWWNGTECWEWTAGLYSDGYGKFGVSLKTYRAHRFAYEMVHGSIPAGLFLLHHCDNKLCIRPDHMFVGTQKDNVDDCMAKGRAHLQNVTPARRAVWQPRGERHGSARLTPDQVRAIRTRHALGGVSYRALGRDYGVSTATITEIVRREIWRHVE